MVLAVAHPSPYTWSTWSAVINLTSRAGELRSAPSGPDDRDRVAGKRALAPCGTGSLPCAGCELPPDPRREPPPLGREPAICSVFCSL